MSSQTTVIKRVRNKGRKGNKGNAPGSTAMAVGRYTEDAISLARRTAQGLNEIRKMINTEKKYLDTPASGNCTQAGTVVSVNLIAQGMDLNNRVGDSVKIQDMKLFFTLAVGAANSNVRVVLFRDLENQGTLPLGSDIFSDAGGAGAAVSQYNFVNTQAPRFSILYDELYSLNILQEVSATGVYQASHRGHIRFRGTTGATASLAEGSLFLVFFTDVAATLPTYRFNFRLEYTDD